ncbi:MAG TPA: hypothetical protein VET65_08230 [Candidatus Limnocylindrales bacterium]|nr:hypothetical protein [Candidatus Limnocylindrales bacterium]
MRSHARFRPAVLSAITSLVAVVAIGNVATVPVVAATPATFNPNLLLPGSSGAAEPSIKSDRLGRAFVIGPTGAQCNAMRVTHDGSSATFIGAPDHNLGGGDCDWAIGPQETATTPTFPAPTDSNIAYSSLDNLVNITVGKSSDGGATFGTANPASTQVVGDDRMWNVADPKLNTRGLNTVFMTYHDISLGDIEMSISTDGGLTYTQSGPIINSTDVPQGQWQGLGALAGNELGNLVARRDPVSNVLTLYSIFATPDSPTDNGNQGVASTANFNRLYEAVGTVTDAVAPAPPTIAWRNYEIYHGPMGARYNRIFPVTAVDAGGRVYAFFSDGNHVFTKSDPTGTGWDASAAPSQVPLPAGINTTVMPWADAGSSGRVDAVFYGATGGAGAQPNPQDDPRNVWNVYFAQSIDGGSTWAVSTASDHVIHTGPICLDGLNCNIGTNGGRDRTLLDFFQVAIDPTNGAADIAYADDHASPGRSVMYYTRQCSGDPAITGLATPVTDCKVPPPQPLPPQGNVCPGPQILDFINDAPNNYPGGTGQNLDNLDIKSGTFRSQAGGSTIDVTLKLKDLEAPPTAQNPNLISAFWTVYWQYGTATGKTWWYAQATTNGTGSRAVASYSYGSWSGNFTQIGTTTGEFHPGPLGYFVIHVPRSGVGSPPDGAHLTNTFADTHGSFTVGGQGLYYTAAADRGPDSGFGADHIVGTPPCPSGSGGGGTGNHEGDGNGNVQGENGGSASFQSDEDGAKDGDQNSEQLSDPGAHDSFHSTQIESVVFDGVLHTVTVTGEGVNQAGVAVAFVIVEQAATATAPAAYAVQLSDGYATGGPLLGGTVTLS